MAGTLFLLQTLAEKPLIIFCIFICWLLRCKVYFVICMFSIMLGHDFIISLNSCFFFEFFFHMKGCWIVYIFLLYPRDGPMIFLLSLLTWGTVFPTVKSLSYISGMSCVWINLCLPESAAFPDFTYTQARSWSDLYLQCLKQNISTVCMCIYVYVNIFIKGMLNGFSSFYSNDYIF